MFLTLGDPKPSNGHEKSNQEEKKKNMFSFFYIFLIILSKRERERERDLQLLKRRQSFITNNNGSANDKQ